MTKVKCISPSTTGPWNSKKTPLFLRTVNQARFIGAKTSIGPAPVTSASHRWKRQNNNKAQGEVNFGTSSTTSSDKKITKPAKKVKTKHMKLNYLWIKQAKYETIKIMINMV